MEEIGKANDLNINNSDPLILHRILGNASLRVAMKRLQRLFRKERLIVGCELAHVPKTPSIGNISNPCRLRIGMAELLADTIEAHCC